MTPEQNAYLAEYVSRSANLLTHMAERGTRYSRDVVREYQRWYNANLSRTQDAFVSSRGAAQNLSQLMQDFSTALGELAVDGLWGERTAFRTALFAVAATPPSPIAAEVAAWWRVRRAEYATKIDNLLAQSSFATREPAPPVEVPVAPPRPGTVVSPDAPPADVVDERGSFRTVTTPGGETEFRITATKPPGQDKTNWFLWAAAAAILGVGGFLVYRNMKKTSGRRSPKKARLLQTATA